GLSTHKCREMVWLGEPVEPQGGIEPPICALPRRRYTPKPLRQRRRPKGGRYLGLSTAIGATRSRDQSLSNARVFATSRTMKASITSFDLRVLVAEWQGLLGGHVDKIYQRDDQVSERYSYPVSGIDSLDLDRDGFAKALQGAKGQVVRILATVLNLGGTYAEELCLRAGVDKETRVKDLQDGQIDSLYTALNNIAVAIDQ